MPTDLKAFGTLEVAHRVLFQFLSVAVTQCLSNAAKEERIYSGLKFRGVQSHRSMKLAQQSGDRPVLFHLHIESRGDKKWDRQSLA